MQILTTEAHRADRLRKALRIATTISSLSEAQADRLIISLSDDHGRLTVRWHHPPTELQRRAFETAWIECKESADRVSHVWS